jgi:hypothetical protein
MSETKGLDMDVKDYAAKVSALGITLTEVEAGVRRLGHAARELANWKESTAPTVAQLAGQARSLHPAPWPTFDEINELIKRYWAEHQEVADAWREFSEETRTTLLTLGVKPPVK